MTACSSTMWTSRTLKNWPGSWLRRGESKPCRISDRSSIIGSRKGPNKLAGDAKSNRGYDSRGGRGAETRDSRHAFLLPPRLPRQLYPPGFCPPSLGGSGPVGDHPPGPFSDSHRDLRKDVGAHAGGDFLKRRFSLLGSPPLQRVLRHDRRDPQRPADGNQPLGGKGPHPAA